MINLYPGSRRRKEDPNKQNKKERGEITTNITEIQKIIREYYEQLYANKLDNTEEMDKFLETYSLPRISQEETDNLNRLITTSEIESVKQINKQTNSLQTQVQVWTASLGNSIKHRKNRLHLSFSNYSKKVKRILPNSFYKDTITLIPKPEKDTTKKENYTPISLMNMDANILNKILAN